MDGDVDDPVLRCRNGIPRWHVLPALAGPARLDPVHRKLAAIDKRVPHGVGAPMRQTVVISAANRVCPADDCCNRGWVTLQKGDYIADDLLSLGTDDKAARIETNCIPHESVPRDISASIPSGIVRLISPAPTDQRVHHWLMEITCCALIQINPSDRHVG